MTDAAVVTPVALQLQGVGLGTIALALVGLILLGVAAWYLVRRLSADDTESAAERTTDQQDQQHSLPVRSRVRRLTGPTKALFGVIGVVVLYVTIEIYTYFKTGSPTQAFGAWYVQGTALAAVSIGAGIVYERRRRAAHEGEITLEIDRPDTDKRTETWYYDPTDTTEDDGDLIVHTYKEKRRLGLYRQPMLHADRRDLRNDDQLTRPISDKVAIRIDRERAVEQGGNDFYLRTRGKQLTSSPKNPADIEFLPPFTMSREEKMRLTTNLSNLKDERDHLRTELAQKDTQIQKLSKRLEAIENEAFDTVMGQLERVAPLVSGNNRMTQEFHRNEREGRRSRDDSPSVEEYLGNGKGGDDE